MQAYSHSLRPPGQRGWMLLAAVALHLLMGYGLLMVLGRSHQPNAAPQTITVEIRTQKADPPPPPPPRPSPQLDVPLPTVPPPLVFTIRVPTDTITATAAPSIAPPSPPVPHAVARTDPAVDPRHPLHIGEDYYPQQSKRLGEEGVCVVQVHVNVEGRISDAILKRSSGSPMLDDACLKGVEGQRLLPATEDGKPVASVTVIPIRWSMKR